MLFQASEFSGVGDVVLGAEEQSATWKQYLWTTYTPAALRRALAPAPPATVAEAKADPKKGPKTGLYLDNGYVYAYNSEGKEIRIVLSPVGKKSTVAAGSSAWEAIFAKLVGSKPMTTGEWQTVKAGAAKAAEVAKAKPATYKKVRQAESTLPSVAAPASLSVFDPAAMVTTDTPFYLKWWFLTGAGVVGIGAIWFFTRPKS